jgi:hypothetical protein
MQKLTSLLAVAVAFTSVGVLPTQAQTPRPRTSPHETVSTVIGERKTGNRITLVYGRPYSKAPKTGEVRKIWGGLVPFDKVWRTGADEATLFITQQPIEMGGVTIPAGAYTLFTLPAADGSAKLIVNKQLGQWGLQYDQKQDLARVDLKKDALEKPVDQFTMAVENVPAGGGLLRMMWENTQYSVAFAAKK